jgi:hypothetical protein
MSQKPNTFRITIEGTHELTAEQIWPNGNAPEHPTREDVAKVLKKVHPIELIDSWNLGVDVDVDGLLVHIHE